MSDSDIPTVPPAGEPQGPVKPAKSVKSLTEKLLSLRKNVAVLGGRLLDMVRKPALVKKLFAFKFEVPIPNEGLWKWVYPYRKWVAVAGVLAVLAFGAYKIFFAHKKPTKQSLEDAVAQQAPAKDQPLPVKGFKIGRFNFEDSLNALGTIKGAMEFKLSFEIPGVISSINYREGERYEEGALLMSLRQDDILLRLKRAQAQLSKAETQVQIGEEKEKEHDKLFAMGAIPKSTLDKVKLETESARFEAEAARLEVKAHEAMLEKSNLYAPSAGMIGELSIEEGETITPNTLLGTHVMTEYVYAEFGVVERDVNKIALGQKARVFVDAYPDKTFEGVIENVAPVVAGTSRTATVKVRLENPERLLMPGMFARVRILLYSKKNTLVVPTDSVQGSEGEQFVYVVHTDKETAEKRAIAIGYTRPDYSQVDAGLSEGELIAVSGLEKLEDGKKIRLLETQEAEI
ncbi:MAG: efflux RND transporter periplasmic adaptor subunit [Candidatus Omnitrophota bacterium]|jgi:RND family efflux transporter MFP subunit